jgi:hypothetical protein
MREASGNSSLTVETWTAADTVRLASELKEGITKAAELRRQLEEARAELYHG